MDRLLSSVVYRISLVVLVCLSLGGCGWFGAGVVAARALPAVAQLGKSDAADGPLTEATVVVEDTGRRWRKEVLAPSGDLIQPGRYASGMALRVRWTVPIDVRFPIDALVGIDDRTCRSGTQPAPARWELVDARDEKVGEAWYVERSDLSASRRLGATPVIGRLRGEALGNRVSLALDQEIGWVLILPDPGRYYLRIEWEGANTASILDAQPCIRGWSGIPLSWALEATAPGSPSSAFAPPSMQHGQQMSGVKANTSDEGRSLSPRESVPTTTLGAFDDLRLLGTPEYDLLEVHRVALALEISQRDPLAARPIDPMVASRLKQIRDEKLGILISQGLHGQIRLCLLAERQGIAEMPLTVFGAEPTIPPRLLSQCRGGEGIPQR